MSSQTELDAFREMHLERCGRQPEPISFYANVVADALVLPDGNNKETAYSVMEALRQGAAQVMDMELSDLQLQVIGKQGLESVDALLFDPMPGGSGLLQQLLEHWPENTQQRNSGSITQRNVASTTWECARAATDRVT